MANPRSVGPFYWHPLRYLVKPTVFIDPAETQEIDEPFRRGRGYAVRFPLTKHAIVLGHWQSSHTESEALTYAISGRAMSEEEVNWEFVRGDDEDINV